MGVCVGVEESIEFSFGDGLGSLGAVTPLTVNSISFFEYGLITFFEFGLITADS